MSDYQGAATIAHVQAVGKLFSGMESSQVVCKREFTPLIHAIS
jgi:hypothetical protein